MNGHELKKMLVGYYLDPEEVAERDQEKQREKMLVPPEERVGSFKFHSRTSVEGEDDILLERAAYQDDLVAV